MKLSKLFVTAAAALLPVAVASAYTLSVNTVQLAAPPGAAGNATFIVSVAPGVGDPQIISAQGLLKVAPPLTVGTASVPAGTPLAQQGWTNSAFNVDTTTRGRLLFAPLDDETSLPIPSPIPTGELFRMVVAYPAGLAFGNYPVQLLLDDTYLSDPNNERLNPSSVVQGALVVIPEPASALLLLGALPFLRRRSA